MVCYKKGEERMKIEGMKTRWSENKFFKSTKILFLKKEDFIKIKPKENFWIGDISNKKLKSLAISMPSLCERDTFRGDKK